MNRDKQIEEMASTMLEASTTANVEPVLEMEGKEVILGENATKILNNILEQAYIPFLAEELYNAGYRKASDFAREIFAEINKVLSAKIDDAKKRERHAEHLAHNDLMSFYGSLVVAFEKFQEEIAELKKKYESEGEG